MRFLPEAPRDFQGIYLDAFPPHDFIANLVQLPMMHATKGYSELITDFETDCPRLRKAQMMGIGWLPSANQTRL